MTPPISDGIRALAEQRRKLFLSYLPAGTADRVRAGRSASFMQFADEGMMPARMQVLRAYALHSGGVQSPYRPKFGEHHLPKTTAKCFNPGRHKVPPVAGCRCGIYACLPGANSARFMQLAATWGQQLIVTSGTLIGPIMRDSSNLIDLKGNAFEAEHAFVLGAVQRTRLHRVPGWEDIEVEVVSDWSQF